MSNERCATIGLTTGRCPRPVAYRVTLASEPGWKVYECKECAASRRQVLSPWRFEPVPTDEEVQS